LPPFLIKKLSIYCERTVHNVLFKVMPSLVTTFSHLSDNIWIRVRRTLHLLRLSNYRYNFWYLYMMWFISIKTLWSKYKKPSSQNKTSTISNPIDSSFTFFFKDILIQGLLIQIQVMVTLILCQKLLLFEKN